MAKKKEPVVTVTYDTCTMFMSHPPPGMTCFLCGALIEASVLHKCSRPQEQKPRKAQVTR